jgi:sulfite reductase (ferredoxin)
LKLGKIKCHSSKQGVLRHRNKSPFRRFYTDKAILADLIKNYGANELRFSLKQNIVVRNIKEENLAFIISQIRLCNLGYDTIDITACPGTDT